MRRDRRLRPSPAADRAPNLDRGRVAVKVEAVPRQCTQLLGPGTGQHGNDHIGVHRRSLGSGQNGARLVERERLRRPAGGAPGRLTQQGHIATHQLVEPEDLVVERVNHYFTDDEPVQIGITYVPVALAADSPLATEANTGRGSIYECFAELGHQITSVREEITARMPSRAETTVLAILNGLPVIELLHTGLDRHGQPFEVTRFVMRADRNALDYQISIEDA